MGEFAAAIGLDRAGALTSPWAPSASDVCSTLTSKVVEPAMIWSPDFNTACLTNCPLTIVPLVEFRSAKLRFGPGVLDLKMFARDLRVVGNRMIGPFGAPDRHDLVLAHGDSLTLARPRNCFQKNSHNYHNPRDVDSLVLC